jgi:hypothetical protein
MRHARGGDIILSDGTRWSQSDYDKFRQDFDIDWQAVNNGATSITQRCSVSSEFYNYGFTIPEGRELVVFSYSLRVGEGAYEIDTLRAPDGFTGGNEALKHPLKSSSTSVVSTQVFCGATLAAGTPTVIEKDFIDSGTAIGVSRAGDSVTDEGTLRIWRAVDNIVIRIKRLQANAYITRLRMKVWERDI